MVKKVQTGSKMTVGRREKRESMLGSRRRQGLELTVVEVDRIG